MLFKYENEKIEYVEKIDKSEKKEADGFSAMRKFRDLDKRGIENHAGPGGDSLETIHQNTIVELRLILPQKGTPQVSTISLDGKLVIWDLGVSHFSFDYYSLSTQNIPFRTTDLSINYEKLYPFHLNSMR